MNDNELPCNYCGKPVELSTYAIYKEATGDGMCEDCYFHEMAVRTHAGWDKRVAMAEADDIANYYEEKDREEDRLRELDKQHQAEGGK